MKRITIQVGKSAIHLKEIEGKSFKSYSEAIDYCGAEEYMIGGVGVKSSDFTGQNTWNNEEELLDIMELIQRGKFDYDGRDPENAKQDITEDLLQIRKDKINALLEALNFPDPR